MRYFDRYGREVDLATWATMHTNKSECIVDQTATAAGTLVSTVWLGMEGQMFETMVFLPDRTPVYQERHLSLLAAREAHQRIVANGHHGAPPEAPEA